MYAQSQSLVTRGRDVRAQERNTNLISPPHSIMFVG